MMDSIGILPILTWLLVGIRLVAGQESRYCGPENSCWPSVQQFMDFNASLTGEVLFPSSEYYRDAIRMRNNRTERFPFIVVIVQSAQDVSKSIAFARNHSMKITVKSSGHDYIGRSTADMSLQINVSKMKGRHMNLNSTRHPGGELTAETGNTWIEIYRELDKHGKLIVGGVEPTVSLGGYTLGGGHSPIGRMFGLAADNVLEIEMVSANGKIVTVNDQGTKTIDQGGTVIKSSDTDLYWALRGGGGGTFGIVTKFTYKLHDAPKQFVVMDCLMPMYNDSNNTGRQFLQDFNNLLASTLPPEWGGYEWTSGYASPLYPNMNGSIALHLLHTGEYGSPSFNAILPFTVKYEGRCQFKNVSRYFNWTSGSSGYYRIYIFNTLMQPGGYTDDFIDFLFNTSLTYPSITEEYFFCAGTLIGGNMRNLSADSMAVNPSLRTGITSLSCWMNWVDPGKEDHFVHIGEHLTDQLIKFGKGTFLNEPSYYLPNWKQALWGGHYDRLLAIKRKWDPDNIFTCHHCVGSDIKQPSLTDLLVG